MVPICFQTITIPDVDVDGEMEAGGLEMADSVNTAVIKRYKMGSVGMMQLPIYFAGDEGRLRGKHASKAMVL